MHFKAICSILFFSHYIFFGPESTINQHGFIAPKPRTWLWKISLIFSQLTQKSSVSQHTKEGQFYPFSGRTRAAHIISNFLILAWIFLCTPTHPSFFPPLPSLWKGRVQINWQRGWLRHDQSVWDPNYTIETWSWLLTILYICFHARVIGRCYTLICSGLL